MSHPPSIGNPVKSTQLSAVLLYSEQDATARGELDNYLELLRLHGSFNLLKSYDLEGLEVRRFLSSLPQVDMCLCLLSPAFLSTMQQKGNLLRRLMDEHQVQRLTVVTLLLKSWPTEATPLRSSIVLPAKDKPIKATIWTAPHDAFMDIYQALPGICEAIYVHKRAVEEAWTVLQNDKVEASYRIFLNKYPYCKWAPQALQELNELCENRLWEAAQEKKNALAYYQYLRDAPLRNHYLDAASALNSIEENEDQVWQDLQEAPSPSLFIRYRSLFPKGKYLQEARKGLSEGLSPQLALGSPTKGDSLFLTRKVQEIMKSRTDELFDLNNYLNYALTLRGKLNKLKKNLNNRPLTFLSGWLSGMLILFLLYSISTTSGTLTESLSLSNFRLYAFLLAGVIFSYRVYRSVVLVGEDKEFVSEKEELLKRASVLLKACYIEDDHITAEKILSTMVAIENEIDQINDKGFFFYLFSSRINKL